MFKKILLLVAMTLLSGCSATSGGYLGGAKPVPANHAVVIVQAVGDQALSYVQLCADSPCNNYRFPSVRDGFVALYYPVSGKSPVLQSYSVRDEEGYVEGGMFHVGLQQTYLAPSPPPRESVKIDRPGIYFLMKLDVDMGIHGAQPDRAALRDFIDRHAAELAGLQPVNFTLD